MAEGLETLAAFAEGTNTVDLGRRRHRDRPPHSRGDRREDRRARPAARAPLARRRRRLFEEAPHRDARAPARRCARRLATSAWSSPRWARRCVRSRGAEFDGVFFNWMTPEFAAGARKHVEQGASEAGRETPPVMGYVRTAIGDDAQARLAKEESLLPRAPRRLLKPLRPPRRGARHRRRRRARLGGGPAPARRVRRTGHHRRPRPRERQPRGDVNSRRERGASQT